MIKPNVVKKLISTASVVALSGCSLASMPSGYSPIEKQAVQELSPSNYTPRSENERAAILTQDLFAQATFWSREYDLNPGDLEAAINLASTLRRLGNPRQSIEVAQTTRALYPRDVDLMAELSAALIANNNPKDALPIIDTALGQRPNMARLWSLKGAALDQFEQFPEARQHYSKGLSLAPNDPGIIANVGLSYALEGDPRTAEIWLRRAANMPGASVSTRQNLSLVLGLQNKFEEAEKWARRDVDQQTASNNMSYIRTLRGSGEPAKNVQNQVRPQTYRDVPPAPNANTNLPYGQTAKINSPATRLTNYGQAGAAKMDGANIATARDAALAAARQATANPYVNALNRPQQTAQIPQKMTTQDVLGKISQNNIPKARVAQMQQQKLAGRAPTQRQTQPYPNTQSGLPVAPNGVTVSYPNSAYPQTAQSGTNYGSKPQPPKEPSTSKPARQRRW
jgi:Flp pilus assembly protein TadD